MVRSVGFAAAPLGAPRRMLSSGAPVPLDEIAVAESMTIASKLRLMAPIFACESLIRFGQGAAS